MSSPKEIDDTSTHVHADFPIICFIKKCYHLDDSSNI